MLSDKQFVQEFEETSLDPIHFDHYGHLRISWLYLTQYPVEKASDKITSGIKRYATSLGAPDKFHMTLTKALIYIIAKRIQKLESVDWHDFIGANQDLLTNAKLLLGEYYSEEIIQTEKAKVSFMDPDKKPLPMSWENKI